MRPGGAASSPVVQASGSGHRPLQKATSWDTPKSIVGAGMLIAGSGSGGGAGPGGGGNTGDASSRGVTLDAIVTEYLMNQHALCKTPMVTGILLQSIFYPD